jgi:hypothetical protein
MNKEELFAAAKTEIFGEIPHCPMAQVGRNMAINYFSPLILEAESVMLDMRVPHSGLDVMLKNAFSFSNEVVLTAFPDETKEALKLCADNFRSRYEPLLKELQFKAA